MTTSNPDQLLSDFMDAWAAGRRPDPAAYVARAAPDERDALAREINEYLVWAPDPAYDDAAIAAIEAEPVVRETLAALERDRTLWPSLLPRLRAHFGASTRDVGRALAGALGLRGGEEKASRYLEEMEDGTLPPSGVKEPVFAALGRLFRMPSGDLRAAGDLGGWAPAGAFARAAPDAARDEMEQLEVVADLLGAPAPDEWDEVDELFRGGR